ncbi:Putative protein in type-1 retrotransposable element R1DM [Araneus ventricosus]|uniref:Reverse transcriptase domain-containing protein n=1 Tax=Araneus ventricosus TaxID=182803 RepID=A0A4Y2M7L4_ARAVE|nr:Putative protein in type-1 retrotransposable element R1DM [Araneus ventricosus]
MSCKNDQLFLQAYADDLALVVFASSRKNLEDYVSSFLNLIQDFLLGLNLQIASEKTLAVVFRGGQDKNRQKRGLAILKRPPIFKIGGRTIRTVVSLKYLGIIIDNLLSWTDHRLILSSKIQDLIKNFSSDSGPNWGTSVPLLKHWYLSVIQPSVLYGAAVWGGYFTEKQINILHSIQRVVLIKISKSFRTCPTDALNVFLGLPPLHVVANGFFIKFKIWNARSGDFDFINADNLDLKFRIIEFPDIISDADFNVYTDGSGIDGNVGASGYWFGRFVPDNELADQLAKEATIDGVLLSLPAPYSYLKKFAAATINCLLLSKVGGATGAIFFP